MDECRAAKTPLIELLRSVPKHAVEMYEHNPTHHQNIPYGRLCHEAADALEAWNRRAEDVSIKEYQQDLQLRDDHIAEQAAEISRLKAVIAKCKETLGSSISDLQEPNFVTLASWRVREALAAIKEEGL